MAVSHPVKRLVIAMIRSMILKFICSNLFLVVGTIILSLIVLLIFGINGLLVLFFIATCGVIYSAIDLLNSLGKNPNVFKNKEKR